MRTVLLALCFVVAAVSGGTAVTHAPSPAVSSSGPDGYVVVYPPTWSEMIAETFPGIAGVFPPPGPAGAPDNAVTVVSDGPILNAVTVIGGAA